MESEQVSRIMVIGISSGVGKCGNRDGRKGNEGVFKTAESLKLQWIIEG